MPLNGLQSRVLEANIEIVRRGLVSNASRIDHGTGLVAIKPSGVPCEAMTAGDRIVSDLNEKIVEGHFKPSSDPATHLELYRAFPAIGGVVYTHSEYTTTSAQAGREIPAYGTTHTDYFYVPVPVAEKLCAEEIGGDYVLNRGRAIVRRFRDLDPLAVPAVLVAGHAPFTWGNDPMRAAYHAVVLEPVARMAYHTAMLAAENRSVSQALLDRHYFRKHGAKSTCGQ